MIGILLTLGPALGAYLIGSIPFGLLVGRWFGGVDIRTKGSGNIGATNVGRVLGFRFFLLVFALDFAKGFLPAYYLPGPIRAASGLPLYDLPIALAVASIVGHNYPIYLKFQGGKGVATSLGAMFALDAVASAASAMGFATFLLVTKYVSMSSLLGGIVWLLAHFTRVDDPLARDQIAMTVSTLGLMALLIVRHRKNLARIAAGTEPKVDFSRRKKKKATEKELLDGFARSWLVVALGMFTVLAGGAGFAWNAGRTFEVEAGPYRVAEVARVATTHQRAERLAFLDGGNLLAATCPRYGRVMLYRVTPSDGLELVRDIRLDGKPVALWPTSDRLFVLVRPNNDARHVEEGWLEAVDLRGESAGGRTLVGFYPDDLAITPDGSRALVLTSGRGEGGDHRPLPALTVYDLRNEPNPRAVGRLDFDRRGDDPARLALTPDGRTAAVSIGGQDAGSVAWVDLSEVDRPRLVARRDWPEGAEPDALAFDHLGGLLAVDLAGESLRHQTNPISEPTARAVESGAGDVIEIPGSPDYWAVTLPFDSGVGLMPADPGSEQALARLPIKGRANLAPTRPLGLAYCPGRKLLAVANRSGGSVHLVALKEARVGH